MAPLVWRKSSRSLDRNCLEVATGPEAILLRDSKQPAGPVLRFGHGAWADFLAAVRSGEFAG